jgi:hypothetical protein
MGLAHSFPRHVAAVVVAAISLISDLQNFGASSVSIWVERAPSPSGPWSRIDPATTPLDKDGNPRLPLNNPQEYYRTQLQLSPSTQIGDPIPLQDVPSAIRGRAEMLISKRMLSSKDPEGWPEGVKINPMVMPMHTVAGDGSVKPTFFEFKVELPPQLQKRSGPLPTHPDDLLPKPAGYLLLSATTEDFPVAEFATEGPAPTEELSRLAKTSRIRVVRYGPSLMIAEDESGDAKASIGSTPFRLDPNVFALDGMEWIGNDVRKIDESPKVIPALKTAFYSNYAEFKKDFAEDRTFEKVRQIRAARAKIEWDTLNGSGPSGITLRLNTTTRLFEDMPLSPLPQVDFISDDGDIVQYTVSSTGGIQVTAKQPGTGLFRARADGKEMAVIIKVPSPIVPTAAGDVLDSDAFYARDWSAQPKYNQFNNSNWCPLTGCGPVAWAMLFAWFDREWGVEWAFLGEPSGSRPPADTTTSQRRIQVFSAYDSLHELCDVICGASDEGATWPPDMSEGFKGYTTSSYIFDRIRREWHINAVTGTWPEAGALRCRDAIKGGYPSVVGLGYFWHYALAYGYYWERIDTGGGFAITSRYLKCNMGWGPGVSPRWYNMLDTFYAADVKIVNGSNQ